MAVTVKFHVRAIRAYQAWKKRRERELGLEGAAEYIQKVLQVLKDKRGELDGALIDPTKNPATRHISATYERTLLEYQVRSSKSLFGLFTTNLEILVLDVQELPPDRVPPTAPR